MLGLLICSAGWLLMLVLAGLTLMSTIMSAAGGKIQGRKGATALYIAHLSFFPVVIVCVIAAWVFAAFGAWTVTTILLAAPLVNLIVFGVLLWRG
jgi:isoprenylcysteine carboxyl methyltransferase (ICMT) family protein YpbQ